jgi:hypothetical protein
MAAAQIGHVRGSCLSLHKRHGSEAAHAALLRMPLGLRDVVLVGQLVQAAKRRRGGETMVQVGLPHVRLQVKTPAFHVTTLPRRLGERIGKPLDGSLQAPVAHRELLAACSFCNWAHRNGGWQAALRQLIIS